MIMRNKILAASASALLLLGTGAVAFAATSVDDNVIHGCFNNRTGTLRVIEAGIDCRPAESPIAWNQQGPQGPTGPQGPAGPQGEKGEKGDPGNSAPAKRWYRDRDKDGHGDWYDHLDSSTAPSGYVANNDDCNDDRDDVHPGSTTTGRGWDFDCNGTANETNLVWYIDNDRDGAGDSERPRTGFDGNPGDGYSSHGHDCDDNNPDVRVCNDDPDIDGDGRRAVWAGGDDCNDFNHAIFPGRAETPYDGLDNDCDPDTWDVEPYVADVGRHDPVNFGVTQPASR